MSDSINRRTFIKHGTVLGASALLATNSMGLIENFAYAAGKVDIAAVTGADYYTNTTSAVEILGGIRQFVQKQSTKALLIDSPWRYPGSFDKPDITLAVIRMCLEAGAKEIGVFKGLSNAYWKHSSFADQMETR
jgi:hypothetical protein